MPREPLERFHELLRRRGGRRIRLDELRQAFVDADPVQQANSAMNSALKAALDAGCERGWWSLSRLVDRHSPQRLPQFVLLAPEAERPPARDLAFPWHPAMLFAAELTNRQQIESAQAISRFLSAREGRPLRPVPMNERSFQIFGDEKRLDRYVEDGALFGGRLPLARLAVMEVFDPISLRRF